jgi:hypothetical protein
MRCTAPIVGLRHKKIETIAAVEVRVGQYRGRFYKDDRIIQDFEEW